MIDRSLRKSQGFMHAKLRSDTELLNDYIAVLDQIQALGPLPGLIPPGHPYRLLAERRELIEDEVRERMDRLCHSHPLDVARAMVQIGKRPASRGA